MYRHTTAKCEKKRENGPDRGWEVREFKRLVWAVLLFLTVFLGKKIYPERILAVGEEVVAVLGTNTDLKAVFSELGESVENSAFLLQGMEDFCVEVFGARDKVMTIEEKVLEPELPAPTSGLLAENLAVQSARHAALNVRNEEDPCVDDKPLVGAILTVGHVPDQPLPEGYTMDELCLGDIDTVTPTVGVLTSAFGYRNHPITGKYLFHGGVDIGADEGSPIVAFSDGVVEYIGEDESYGLYTQIDHGNGVKTFYAHCRQLCVAKGQQVTAGEKVATVGSTGRTTGAHLHLEIKCGELRVDPSYYMNFLTQG